jgi:hypothetical protein
LPSRRDPLDGPVARDTVFDRAIGRAFEGDAAEMGETIRINAPDDRRPDEGRRGGKRLRRCRVRSRRLAIKFFTYRA